MSLSYTLVINGGVYGTQSARNAYGFACALLDQGHTLASVFFYQDGVSNASRLIIPANDEVDLTAAWQALSLEHGIRLEACVAASLRRGIIAPQEAKQHQRNADNIADEFELAGLGSLAEALLSQDRVVQF
jgi:tRNA 2-thiouridine synthesizing protein D